MEELPICRECKYCFKLKKNKNHYDIECGHNPNLGGVGAKYAKCPSYQKRRNWLQ